MTLGMYNYLKKGIMKKILVPTDFTALAENGLDQAVKMAKKIDAKVTVLHCLDLANQYSDTETGALYLNSFIKFFDDLKEDTNKKLTAIRDRYKEEVDIQVLFLEGNPKFQIADYANENNYDLIVMGTEGSDGFSEVFFGSVAEKVVRRSLTPVLSMGNKNKNIDLSKIALVSDFRENSHVGYAKALKFIKALGTTLLLARINTPFNFENTGFANKLMDDFAHKYELENYQKEEYNHERFEVGVYKFAQEHDLGLVIIGTHGRSGVTHLFKNSLAEDVVNHLGLPILTFNIQ